MSRLEAAGVGYPVGTGVGEVVPIVPAAVMFDLGRGGDFGAAARSRGYDAANSRAVAQGAVDAGTGAAAGGLKGGVGSASAVLAGGVAVAALVVLNAAGSAVDPGTGELYGTRFGLGGELSGLRAPDPGELAAARGRMTVGSLGAPLQATRHHVRAVDGHRAGSPAGRVHELLAAAADCVTRAVVHAVLAAESVRTPVGDWPSYRGLLPSSVR